MKLINDTTAVKTPVKKGIQSGGKVEILSPKFDPNRQDSRKRQLWFGRHRESQNS
jgi:hypothetical protein